MEGPGPRLDGILRPERFDVRRRRPRLRSRGRRVECMDDFLTRPVFTTFGFGVTQRNRAAEQADSLGGTRRRFGGVEE